jgi:hypothetical protein
MAGGSLRLQEYPGEVVRLSCAKCGRARVNIENRIRSSAGAIMVAGLPVVELSDSPASDGQKGRKSQPIAYKTF